MERRVEGIAVFSASHVLIDDIGVRQLGGIASELKIFNNGCYRPIDSPVATVATERYWRSLPISG
jgi:hypothetical protein